MKRFLFLAALLATAVLAGCGYRPSTAKCFNYVAGPSPCTFTPVSSAAPWGEVIDEADG